jgi:C4-dicarboxylate-specific signal transduction histidine kinase
MQTNLMGYAEGCACLSEERQSEIRQTNLMGYAEGCACLSEEQRSEIRQTHQMGHAEGHACLSEKQRSEIRQTNRTGHAEGHACLSAERRSEIRQTNWTRHVVEGRARLLSEEQHAENGAHHLNLLLLNHFFLILYLLSLITLQDKKLKDPVIFFHMPCTTAS